MHTIHTIHTIHIQYIHYIQYIPYTYSTTYNTYNPLACRRVWLEGVVLVSVLGLYLFLCSLAARFCFVWIKVTPTPPLLKHHSHATWLGPAWQLSWRPCLQLRAQPVRLAQVAIRPHCSKKLQFLCILLGIRDSWNKFRNAVPWHSMAAEASCSDRAHQELVFQLQQPSTMSWVASDQSLDRLSGQTKWPSKLASQSTRLRYQCERPSIGSHKLEVQFPIASRLMIPHQ